MKLFMVSYHGEADGVASARFEACLQLWGSICRLVPGTWLMRASFSSAEHLLNAVTSQMQSREDAPSIKHALAVAEISGRPAQWTSDAGQNALSNFLTAADPASGPGPVFRSARDLQPAAAGRALSRPDEQR